MNRVSASLPLIAAMSLLVIAATLSTATSTEAGSDEPALAIDVGTEGNSASDTGEIEDCISVGTGDTFEIDVLVLDITDLLAWEVHLDYDAAVLTVINHDVKLFQGANTGSSPIDISARLPDDSGFHTLSAFESSDPPRVDSGSGVLARVTLEATAEGETDLAIGQRDINDDGTLDRGTLMRDVDANVIGDTDGDNYFDGDVSNAIVVVGDDCPSGYNVATPGASESESTPWWAFGAAGAVLLVVAAGAGVVLLIRRRASA
jgi:hypothetical protein